MNDRLKLLFHEIEDQRKRLISSVSMTPAVNLNKSLPGKWSITQILNHIVSAERLSVIYLRKKMLGINEAHSSGITEELKMIMLIVSQRVPGLKFKAPKVVQEMTTDIADLPSISKQWDEVRNELKNLLEKIPAGQEKKLIYKHVRAGRLNVFHALKFFREHVIHHTPQIKKLL